MKSFFFVFLLVGTLFAGQSRLRAEDFRTFTNSAGKTIEARVDRFENGQVSITLRDGKQFTLPASSLSETDREFLSAWRPAGSTPDSPAPLPAEGVTADRINEAIGHQLFADSSLWASDPVEVAARLNWTRESKTENSESYRNYPREDYRFLGARPHSAALYGDGGKVAGVSIVFANKGDSFRSAGRGEDHFIKGKPVPGGMEGVRVIMGHDAETIGGKLTSLLGEPEKQKFGEGEARVYVDRWDWAGHSFLLSHVEDEYVALAVQTIEFAEDRGRSKRVPDSVIRERARGYVENRENGDVVITNIPMVDQGPKGYCVPATVERCMRFLGIPADMYLLAMMGETRVGGGTAPEILLSNIGTDIKRKGRSFEIESRKLKLRDVKRSIDDGIPIMWALCSTRAFNDTANARLQARQNENWESYKATVAAAADSPALSPDRSRGHIVIIMGYNEETNEIAFSDSWGERYLERWITVPEAEQISLNKFYTIDL
jgi:hypothetical protein